MRSSKYGLVCISRFERREVCEMKVGCAMVELPDETEGGSAGKQPTEG
jgi:hypothetical protein